VNVSQTEQDTWDDGSRKNVVDHLWQFFYASAFQGLKLYWALRHPKTHGALVAIWYKGTILLVRQSYLSYFSLPGGYLHKGEDGRHAAVREAREELGIELDVERLRPVLDKHQEWQNRQDHVEIFEVEIDTVPKVRIDNREVVMAAFFRVDDALRLELYPPIREILETRLSYLTDSGH
jgi:8-oxo-dGTP diphosphatase